MQRTWIGYLIYGRTWGAARPTVKLYRLWLSARLLYLHCQCTGDMHWRYLDRCIHLYVPYVVSFSNAFSQMKSFAVWFKFHRFVPEGQLDIKSAWVQAMALAPNRGKNTTQSALGGAVVDPAQILAYLVHNSPVSKWFVPWWWAAWTSIHSYLLTTNLGFYSNILINIDTIQNMGVPWQIWLWNP